MGFEEAADALYALAPEDFLAARKRAVTAAKTAGDAAAARAVGALRRPTRSAWLVNLLIRQRSEFAAGLEEVAAVLAAAHTEADLAAVQAAGARRARFIEEFVAAAADVATATGYRLTEAVRAEIAGTVRAALTEGSALAAVLAGRLDTAQVHAGFGPPITPPATAGTPGQGPRPLAGVRPIDVERAQRALSSAVAARQRAEQDAAEARAVLDRAHQEVADLADELRAAQAAEVRARAEAEAAAERLRLTRSAERAAAAALVDAGVVPGYSAAGS